MEGEFINISLRNILPTGFTVTPFTWLKHDPSFNEIPWVLTAEPPFPITGDFMGEQSSFSSSILSSSFQMPRKVPDIIISRAAKTPAVMGGSHIPRAYTLRVQRRRIREVQRPGVQAEIRWRAESNPTQTDGAGSCSKWLLYSGHQSRDHMISHPTADSLKVMGAVKTYTGLMYVNKGHLWQTQICSYPKSAILCESQAQHPSYQNLGMMPSIPLLGGSNGGWLHSLKAACDSLITTWLTLQQRVLYFFSFCVGMKLGLTLVCRDWQHMSDTYTRKKKPNITSPSNLASGAREMAQ